MDTPNTTAPHTTEEDFQHFLSYSNALGHPPTTEAELVAWLRYAYFDGRGDPTSLWPLAAQDAAKNTPPDVVGTCPICGAGIQAIDADNNALCMENHAFSADLIVK